tara:strand:+ start:314 stop:421 length:108 start_codon:yes stop_codon:yes gene_type:complete
MNKITNNEIKITKIEFELFATLLLAIYNRTIYLFY